MGLKEDKLELESIREKMFSQGMKVIVYGSFDYHNGKLMKAKDAKEFEKIKKERLKEIAEGEKIHRDHESTIKQYKTKFASYQQQISAFFTRMKQARAVNQELMELVSKYNKGVEEYNKQWLGGKIVGEMKPKIVRDYSSELDGIEKPMLKEKENVDDEAKLVVSDLDSDFNQDTKRLKESKAKIEKAHFQAKGKKK